MLDLRQSLCAMVWVSAISTALIAGCRTQEGATLTAQPGTATTAALPPGAATTDPARPAAVRIDDPPDLKPDWLEGRRQAQLATLPELKVFHDFQLADRRPESGITFVNRVVDDAAKTYKPVHYDHGTGLAAADVDGDGLADLYFVNQVGPNQLWHNLGGGKFEDITAGAGVALPDRIGVGASFADTDNDGDADLYVTTVRGGNALFENDGAGHFTDVSAASGLDYSGHSSGAVFFDYDKDGLLDLFLANVGQYTSDELRTTTSLVEGAGLPPGELVFYDGFEDAFAGHLKPERTEISRVFHNQGGNRFEDVTEAVGLVDQSWTGDAGVIDGNDDGWPDLYVLNMQGNDEYWENDQGKRFVKRSREVFPKTPWGSMGIAVFDFDNDGRLDIYVTDMHSDMSRPIELDQEKQKSEIAWPEDLLRTAGASIFGNAFYKNEGGGRYTEISDAIGAETFWPWGVSAGDLNADGYPDAFVTAGMGFPYRYAVNSVLLNNQGERFLDSELILGAEPRRDARYAQPWFELDCSGADQAHPGCQGKTGRVAVWAALSSRSSALLDLDEDGDLDIVTNDFDSEPMVLVSNLGEANPALHFLKVRLKGNTSNRAGIGALVKVVSGGKTYVQANDGKSGYLSQSLLPLYFGLGESDTVDRIEVTWPSGQTQVLEGPIQANTTVDVEESQP